MNLLKAASTVSLWTLASRVTGLVREQLIAAQFGATAATDAYQVAFRIPNLLRRMFAEGAFSQAFVPALAAARASQGDAATHQLIDAVATVLCWSLLLVSAAGVIGAPVLVWVMASGLDRLDLATVMTRWMFPYIGCMSMVALAAGILNTWRRFAVPAATPVLLNAAVIVAALWLAPTLQARGTPPIYALAVGVMVGGVAQMLLQVPALIRVGVFPRIAFSARGIAGAWRHPGVQGVLRQMLPALLGVSVAQLSLLINTQIASHLTAGSVSWLTFADRLMEFPTALLGVALGVVLTPQLSAMQARGDQAGYSGHLDWGLRLSLLLAAPCAIALLLFPLPLVAVLYHYGRFGAADVTNTVLALQGYGVGLLGLIGVKVLAPAYYARQDMRTPVRIAVVVLICTQLLNLLLVPRLAHAGLALSIGLGALFNAGWLYGGLRRSGLYRPEPGWGGFALKLLVANAALAGWLYWAGAHFDWLAWRAAPGARAGALAGVLLGAAALYFALLMALGLRWRQFLRRG